jgi:ribosome-associated protein
VAIGIVVMDARPMTSTLSCREIVRGAARFRGASPRHADAILFEVADITQPSNGPALAMADASARMASAPARGIPGRALIRTMGVSRHDCSRRRAMLRINAAIAIPDSAVEERFVPLAASRSAKRVRRNCGIELRLDILSASLPEEVQTRLLALRDRRITSDGVLVVISRAHASQARNRDAARAQLIDIVRTAATAPPDRHFMAPPVSSRPARKTGRSQGAFRRAVKGDLT